MRTKLLAGLLAGALLLATVGGAAAFEPPKDPADVFSCPNGNPVAGHPGAVGLMRIVTPDHLAAWNAVFNSTPVTLCG